LNMVKEKEFDNLEESISRKSNSLRLDGAPGGLGAKRQKKNLWET